MASLYQILKRGGVCLVFWAELHGAMSRDVTIFCFTLWKKRRKRMYRLPFPPCGFSSYTYNPPDKTWFATIKAVFIFEEIVKKYQLKPLPPSQQQQQQQKTVKWVKNSTDLTNSSYQSKKEIIRNVDWWSNMQCQTAFFFFFFLMSSYSLLFPFFSSADRSPGVFPHPLLGGEGR